MEQIGFYLELLIAGLLAVTVLYCFRLDGRLKALRSGSDGMRELIEALDAATTRAVLCLRDLRAGGVGAVEALDERVASAQKAARELDELISLAGRKADRLAAPPVATGAAEAAIRGRADAKPPEPSPQKAPPPLVEALRLAR